MKNMFDLQSMKRLLFIVGVLSAVTIGSQQTIGQPMTMTVSYAPIQQLSIADVDFDHFESRTLLFTLRITNPNATTCNAKVHIILAVKLADGSYTSAQAMSFTSKEFPIPPGVTNITNLDIGRGKRIEKEDYQLSDEAKTKVQDVALATGKFPSRQYKFNFTLENSTCTCDDNPSFELVFENPSRIELRSPRDGELTNEFPMFEFYSDGANIQLTVAEKTADQSREEAIHREPPMNSVSLYRQNSYVYTGGRPLEDGKTYVWQVVTKTLGPGGTNVEVSSPIGLFIVSNSVQTNGAEDVILRLLKEMFSPRYPGIFQQIEHGEWTLNSGGYTLNGSALSQSELLKLLNDLQQIKDDVELSLEGE